MITGIVLAAGMSSRMGRLKQILPLGGRPAIAWIVEALAGRVDEVLVVLGHRADEVRAALAEQPVRTAVNEAHQLGMLSSVQCGVNNADPGADFLICLGDQPQLDGQVVERVVRASAATADGIVIPTYHGKRGHPIFIRNSYRAEILALSLDRGLNVLMQHHPGDIHEIAVDQTGILDDMDTPADYRREQEKWRQV